MTALYARQNCFSVTQLTWLGCLTCTGQDDSTVSPGELSYISENTVLLCKSMGHCIVLWATSVPFKVSKTYSTQEGFFALDDP